MDWEQIARTIAPTIATGLLGPLGGVVTNIAGEFLFPASTDRSKLTPQDVVNKITTMSDPADVAKLREAELAIRKFESDNEFRFAQMETESAQNARAMRVTSLSGGNRTADRLAWVTLISFFTVATLILVVVGLMLGGVLSLTNDQNVWIAVSGMIGSVLGYFSANANQVVSFYFGSSAGSAAKADQLAQQASQALTTLGRTAASAAPAFLSAPDVAPAPQAPWPSASATVAASRPDLSQAVGPTVAPLGFLQDSDDDLAKRWQTCVAFVLDREGGFVDNAADRGGATNLGVTLNTLEHFRKQPVSVDDVRQLQKSEAETIYQQEYWDASRCDDLPAGVDLCVFDSTVLCGPKRAGVLLQSSIGLHGKAVDGRIGRKTIEAARGRSAREVVEAIADARKRFHCDIVSNDPSQEPFLRGWLNRVQQLRTKALELVEG